MLIGEYSTILGDKNRIALPKKLRDRLQGKVYVTRGYEDCLILIDEKRWQYLLEQINTKPLLNVSVRDTKRFLSGGATEVDYDVQGRFVLPEHLIKFAQLEQKIVFLGLQEWVEIWAEQKWQEKLLDLKSQANEIAERLSM